MGEIIHAVGQICAGLGAMIAAALLFMLLCQEWFWQVVFGLFVLAALLMAPFALYDLGGVVLRHLS